eukprot:273216-Pleurochrysis_carterae.AAC.1
MSQLHRVKWAARRRQCAARLRRDPPRPLRQPLGGRHRYLRKAARGPARKLVFCQLYGVSAVTSTMLFNVYIAAIVWTIC